MPYPVLYRHPSAAVCFSVVACFCRVAWSPQAARPMGWIWHGNGKPQRRRCDWSPRPATKPLPGLPKPTGQIPASSTSSASLHGKLQVILSNRRRPVSRVTASPIREALA